jgi:hypothetical protein
MFMIYRNSENVDITELSIYFACSNASEKKAKNSIQTEY